MTTLLRKTWAAALAGVMVLALAAPAAQAQFLRRPNPFYRPYFGSTSAFRQGTLPVYSSGVNPNAPFYNPVMPLYRTGPGTSMQQAMYNTYAPLYAASRLPPWMFGYNPYPAPVIPANPYSVSMYNPYANPYLSSGNYYALPPYGVTANPYAAAFSPYAATVNPYAGY